MHSTDALHLKPIRKEDQTLCEYVSEVSASVGTVAARLDEASVSTLHLRGRRSFPYRLSGPHGQSHRASSENNSGP